MFLLLEVCRLSLCVRASNAILRSPSFSFIRRKFDLSNSFFIKLPVSSVQDFAAKLNFRSAITKQKVIQWNVQHVPAINLRVYSMEYQSQLLAAINMHMRTDPILSPDKIYLLRVLNYKRLKSLTDASNYITSWLFQTFVLNCTYLCPFLAMRPALLLSLKME